jgi:hypothetical protein
VLARIVSQNYAMVSDLSADFLASACAEGMPSPPSGFGVFWPAFAFLALKPTLPDYGQ